MKGTRVGDKHREETGLIRKAHTHTHTLAQGKKLQMRTKPKAYGMFRDKRKA